MFTSSEAGALQGGYGRDMSYQIARAHIRDLPRVKPLWKSMLRRYADVAGGDWPVRDPATAWARRHEEYLSWLNEGAGVIFLAIDSETQDVVGYAALHFCVSGSTFDTGERFGELESLAVSEELRGRGIGSQLLEACRSELSRREISFWALETLAANVEATRLYERSGFTPFMLRMIQRVSDVPLADPMTAPLVLPSSKLGVAAPAVQAPLAEPPAAPPAAGDVAPPAAGDVAQPGGVAGAPPGQARQATDGRTGADKGTGKDSGSATDTAAMTAADAPSAPVTEDTDEAHAAPDEVTPRVREAAEAARFASRELALATRDRKDEALRAMADALVEATERILMANWQDVQRMRSADAPDGLVDRLSLDATRVAGMAEGLRKVATLPDPVGEVVRGSRLANGLTLRQVRVPLGVVGMIYEARPNVTADAAGLCLKSGNAVILRGGSAAADSNRAIVAVLADAVASVGLPADAIGLLDGDHEEAVSLMRARGLIDVIIPRGGERLIRTVVGSSRVPVIETGSGNVHVYVDAAADLAKVLPIVLNAKTQRPSVCNAAETLLVHAAVAQDFLADALPRLAQAGVTLHGDERAVAAGEAVGVSVLDATSEDWATEFHGLEMSVGVVDSLDHALRHVTRFSTGHTEAIVTEDLGAARRWTSEVDAAVVAVNASTRFTDGGEFGFGAEIGVSTQKLHARGPMALSELTSTKWVLEGDGQVRG